MDRRKINHEKHKLKTNWTEEEFVEFNNRILTKYLNKKNRSKNNKNDTYDGLIYFVVSYGKEEECIYMSNGDEFVLGFLFDAYDNQNLEYLREKPKIFFINCARGDKSGIITLNPNKAIQVALRNDDKQYRESQRQLSVLFELARLMKNNYMTNSDNDETNNSMSRISSTTKLSQNNNDQDRKLVTRKQDKKQSNQEMCDKETSSKHESNYKNQFEEKNESKDTEMKDETLNYLLQRVDSLEDGYSETVKSSSQYWNSTTYRKESHFRYIWATPEGYTNNHLNLSHEKGSPFLKAVCKEFAAMCKEYGSDAYLHGIDFEDWILNVKKLIHESTLNGRQGMEYSPLIEDNSRMPYFIFVRSRNYQIEKAFNDAKQGSSKVPSVRPTIANIPDESDIVDID